MLRAGSSTAAIAQKKNTNQSQSQTNKTKNTNATAAALPIGNAQQLSKAIGNNSNIIANNTNIGNLMLEKLHLVKRKSPQVHLPMDSRQTRPKVIHRLSTMPIIIGTQVIKIYMYLSTIVKVDTQRISVMDIPTVTVTK
jgi:hypothetical protein